MPESTTVDVTLPNAEIDWYADGLEARLVGRTPTLSRFIVATGVWMCAIAAVAFLVSLSVDYYSPTVRAVNHFSIGYFVIGMVMALAPFLGFFEDKPAKTWLNISRHTIEIHCGDVAAAESIPAEQIVDVKLVAGQLYLHLKQRVVVIQANGNDSASVAIVRDELRRIVSRETEDSADELRAQQQAREKLARITHRMQP